MNQKLVSLLLNFKWTSTNNNVGIINSLGRFSGISDGKTTVIVEWGNVSDTAYVNIELKEGTTLLNSFDNIDEWSLSGKDFDTTNSFIEIIYDKFTEGNSSLKLNYEFTYLSGIQNWAYLNTEIPIDGIPLNFAMDVNVNDYTHSIAYIVTNYSGEEFAILHKNNPDIDELFDTLTAKLDKPIPLEPNNIFHFPIVIRQIAIILNTDREINKIYSGSILFDNLRTNYSENPVSVEELDDKPNSYRLFQNYPNPYNPTTTIKYSIPSQINVSSTKVKITVFDILGRNITTLVDKSQNAGNYSITFNASTLASGVYYYTLNAGNFIQSKKMIVLR